MATTTEEISNAAVCVGEQYATATSSSNLRVEADRRTQADVVLAAGMSQHRMGMALSRLMSEWDASAKPHPMPVCRVEELARSYPKLSNGLVAVFVDGVEKEQVLPIVLAKREADHWHAHELGILFQRMKSLPLVREGLLYESRVNGWEGGEHLVAGILQWWLNPICPVCQGVKDRVVAGTGRTGALACGACRGSGEARLPYGWQGRKMLEHIQACRVAAVKGLQGKFRHQK